MRRHRNLVPTLAVLLLVAACQSNGSSAGSAASPTGANDTQLLAAGQRYSQCVRDHGVSEFPDLVVVNGFLALPDGPGSEAGKQALDSNTTAKDACQSILDQLPASAHKNAPVTEEELANLLKYAECLRANGIPEWPDPRPDGTFPLSQALKGEGKSSRMRAASDACDDKLGDVKGVRVK